MQSRLNTLLGLCVVALAGCAAAPNPSFSVSTRQAEHAIEEMRHDPKPLPRPLVVVGGFLDLNISPPIMRHFYSKVTKDSTIIPVSLGLCGSFEECRETIISAVDKASPNHDPQFTAEVDVVGASLGGLAARYAAAPSRDPTHQRRLKIVRLFTISSPHSGATLAREIGFTNFHRDMQAGSEFLNRLAMFDATATYTLYPYVHLHDEVVGEQYAAPPGVTPWWLADSGLLLPHPSAIRDPRIHADIARRLRGETPLTISPPVPLPGKSDHVG